MHRYAQIRGGTPAHNMENEAAPGCSRLLLAAPGCPGCFWLLLAAAGCSWRPGNPNQALEVQIEPQGSKSSPGGPNQAPGGPNQALGHKTGLQGCRPIKNTILDGSLEQVRFWGIWADTQDTCRCAQTCCSNTCRYAQTRQIRTAMLRNAQIRQIRADMH